MKVKIINKSKNRIPEYGSEHAAGMDVLASLDKPLTLKPMERCLISTGLYIELPVGYEAQIRPRSGMAINHGISIVNSPGTIDADYRGEIGIILINLSEAEFVVNNGDRICQMVISKHERITWKEVKSLGKTKRGKGGFGHTGK